MRFANPQLLWLLLVFPPALLVFFWWSWKKQQVLRQKFIQARLLPALTIGISPFRQKIRMAFIISGVVCLLLALARPQWGFDWEEVKQRGLDIVVAIDTSKSMLAEDIAPNRLARAKLAALDLMQQAKSDRLGLVAFAGGAFLQCPLTIDDSAFRQSVESLDVNIIPQGGTALAEAIQTAVSAYKEGDNHKVLVLFTDGEDQDSGAVEQAKKAGEEGLQIFTIGIGSTEGELLRTRDAKGRTDYIRDDQGNVVKSHLNETLLREIASATPRGFYLPLRGAKTIDTLYAQGLAPLPKSESNEKLVKRYHERYHWPLGLAIVLLLAEMLWPEMKRETRKKTAEARDERPVLAEAALLLLLLLLPTAVFGSPSSALREYQAGKYDQALKEYEQLLERRKEDPRLHYNAGAAAYRNQKFDEAAKQFTEALSSPDLKLQQQAYYNLGNANYYLGEKTQDPSQRTKTWEEAVRDFESTMKLNPQDADAKYNHEFVKKRLEELKQQQQQQKKDDKNKDNKDNKDDQQKDQDQQQQQQQDKQDQDQKKDEQKKSQDQQSKSDQKQNQPDQKPDDKKEQAANQPKDSKEQQPKEQQPKQANQSKDKGDPKEQGEPGQAVAGQMTQQQAQQLLDAQKGDEMMLPVKPEIKAKDQNRTLKDW